MKVTFAFVISLLLQTITAEFTEAEKSSPGQQQLNTSSAFAVGDRMAQELVENYVVFRWEANNTFAQESFEFQLNEPTVLQVVDFKYDGDMFDVYDNGKQIGSTSKVMYDEDLQVYAATPQESLTNERFSKGSFNLDKGQHNVTILAHGPYETGSAAIRLLQRSNFVLAQDAQEQPNNENEKNKEENTAEDKQKDIEDENEEEKISVEEEEEEEEEEKKMNVEEEQRDMEEQQHEEQAKEEELEEEESEDEEEAKEEAPIKKTDRDNWKKMLFKKKSGTKDHQYEQFKHHNGTPKRYHGQRYNDYHKYGRPAYHKASYNGGPKTVTHWKIVRKTAVPYATRLAFEKEESHQKY